MGRWRGRRDGAEDEVLRLLRAHAGELLRFARRFSLCADDAQDAYQRSVEIFLRRMRTEPPEKPIRWLQTVLRHEALAVREQRLQDVGRDELDLDVQPGGGLDDPADRAERFERLEHAAEALRRLKPQEVTALVLRAEGFSYEEICDRTGWSYTRCNRAITEGRRALIARMKAIESGAECERWVPLLSLLADGEASARDLADLRPHLRSCRACRATLRGFHEAPRQIGALVPAELLPVALAGAGGGHGFGIGRQLEALAQTLSERATAGAMRMQGALDALPATKVAAVAASTAAIAGGGAAIDRVATGAGERGGGGPDRTIAAATPVSGAAQPILATGPTATPILRLPAGRAAAGARDPQPVGPVAAPAPSVGEFAFEPDPAGDRERERERRRRAAAGAARAARSAPATTRPTVPAQPAPAEFKAPSTSAPSAAAASSPDPAPSSPAPSTAAEPEFAGP